MYLRLGQLVYTSFAETGLRVLASVKIPEEIKQALVQRIAFRYWDSYNPPKSGYRAVYIYQVSLERTLFGWFYNDQADDMGRTHLPYFICYYLNEPLQQSQLENIFTCLHKGPVSFIDRHNPPVSLETLVISDLSYQPARPGVAIPLDIFKSSHIALKKKQLLDLYIPISEQEIANELHKQQEEVDSFVERLEKAATLETEIIQSRQGYSEKLQQYQQALIEAIERHYPITKSDRRELKRLQQDLELKDEEIETIESQIAQAQEKVAGELQRDSTLMAVTQRADTGLPRKKNLPQQTRSPVPRSTQSSQKSAEHNSMITYRNIKLLLWLGIATTVLALLGSIYGLWQTRRFVSSNPKVISSVNNLIFYKTLDEVPNVPLGLFNYGGSTTFAPLRSPNVVSALNQAHPQFQLRYTQPVGNPPGSGKGIEMLLAGELSFAQSSRPLKDNELAKARERGFKLEQIPVALDGIAVYVNPQLSIPGLSLSQLRDIFTGKITNWKAVGGPDLPITPVSRNSEASGTVDFFKENVLAEENLGANVVTVKNTTESIRKVANTPGSIGYATASEVIGQKSVRPLPLSRGAGQPFVSPLADANGTEVNTTAFADDSYPLTRRLFVIIKRDGRLDEQAGNAYVDLLLSDEGQRLVKQAGFVPVR